MQLKYYRFNLFPNRHQPRPISPQDSPESNHSYLKMFHVKHLVDKNLSSKFAKRKCRVLQCFSAIVSRETFEAFSQGECKPFGRKCKAASQMFHVKHFAIFSAFARSPLTCVRVQITFTAHSHLRLCSRPRPHVNAHTTYRRQKNSTGDNPCAKDIDNRNKRNGRNERRGAAR